MTDHSDLKAAAVYAGQDVTKFADEDEEMRALQQFHEEVDPETVLELIAEINALKGPHDWLAEDLIKELVDNAQAIQENADDGGEDPFVIVLLAAAQRIRRQEANLDQLKTENKRLMPFDEAYATACNVRNRLIKENELLDRLVVTNKAISDSFRAERDQLKAELAGLRTGYEAYESVNKGLKAENETLVAAAQALRDEWRKDQSDAERYRYLRDRCGLVEYKVIAGSIGPGMLPSGEKLDVAIDAALGKGEQA